MEFYLISNKKLQFLGDTQNDSYIYRYTRDSNEELTVKLSPLFENYATKALTDLVHTKIWKAKENDKINWTVQMKIGFSSIHSIDDDLDESIMEINLDAYGENNFLYRIGNMFSKRKNVSNVSLKFVVTDFGPIREIDQANGNMRFATRTNWSSDGEKILFLEREYFDEELRQNTFCRFLWQHNWQDDVISAWRNKEDFQGNFTIILTLSDSVLNTLLLPEQIYFGSFRKMLAEKIAPDIKLVASDEMTVKCHRAMIAASSEKLADLLKSERGKHVEIMNHLCHDCIMALLDYIYCRDISKILCDNDIAIQVLKTALEFELKDLTEVVQKVLLVKPSQWYGVDEAVELFLIASSLGLPEDDSSASENDLNELGNVSSASENDSSEFQDVSSASEDYSNDSADEKVDIEQFDGYEDDYKSETTEDTNNTDDTHDWAPMKKRAVEVLKWYSKNKYKDLMASSKYQQLFRDTPQAAMEVGKIFLQLG